MRWPLSDDLKKLSGRSEPLKVRLYHALILPIVTYAAETWTLTAEDTRRLEAFEMRCLRAILGVTRRDRLRNEFVPKDAQCVKHDYSGSETETIAMVWTRYKTSSRKSRQTSLPPRLPKSKTTVNHEILLEKMQSYGVRGIALELIRNYLTNRKQYVAYGDKTSNHMTIKCGVPQGSILGPTLFLLYINDIKNVSNLLKFIIFADDTNIFHSSDNIEILETTINQELKKLATWFKANKLSLNIDKTSFILFSKKRIRKSINIIIDNKAINEVHETKFLGVIIDKNLTWTTHIECV